MTGALHHLFVEYDLNRINNLDELASRDGPFEKIKAQDSCTRGHDDLASVYVKLLIQTLIGLNSYCETHGGRVFQSSSEALRIFLERANRASFIARCQNKKNG